MSSNQWVAGLSPSLSISVIMPLGETFHPPYLLLLALMYSLASVNVSQDAVAMMM